MTTPIEGPEPQPSPQPIETQVVIVEVNPDPMMSQIIERNDPVTNGEMR
jgi:hypothetical protein